MSVFGAIFGIFFFIIPLICIPYIFLQTFESIWWGGIFYKMNQKENLKWNIQRILVTILTTFFAYINARIIYDDFYVNELYEDLLIYFSHFLLYPSLLFVYYLILFIFYYKKYLNNNTLKEILNKDLNNDHYGKKYVKFSKFLLASIFFSMWWVVIAWFCIAIGSWGQQ